MNYFKVGKRKIGKGHPVFIVAEVSCNHQGSYRRAVKIVEAACRAGVDAIKLQTFKPDRITINERNKWFWVRGTNSEWWGQTLYQLYKKAYTPWEWQPKLKKIAESHGVTFFSTPFDEAAVDFLEKMKVPVYKVASFETGDLELLRKVGGACKPVIMSRGLASWEEMQLAVKTLRKSGAPSVAVLHCVSSYPAKPEEMNLATIPALQKKLGVVAGLSDHTLGIETSVAAVALGAKIIEKHVTLKRSDGGPDASFSLEPNELKNLVQAVRNVEKAVGSPQFKPGKREAVNLVFRRSLFVVEDIKAGDVFTAKNIRSIRPGYGLLPKFLPKILGRKAFKNIKRGTPLTRNLIAGKSW